MSATNGPSSSATATWVCAIFAGLTWLSADQAGKRNDEVAVQALKIASDMRTLEVDRLHESRKQTFLGTSARLQFKNTRASIPVKVTTTRKGSLHEIDTDRLDEPFFGSQLMELRNWGAGHAFELNVSFREEIVTDSRGGVIRSEQVEPVEQLIRAVESNSSKHLMFLPQRLAVDVEANIQRVSGTIGLSFRCEDGSSVCGSVPASFVRSGRASQERVDVYLETDVPIPCFAEPTTTSANLKSGLHYLSE